MKLLGNIETLYKTDKLVSEVNGTGAKIKTFVTANGTTLAEQERNVFNNNAETVVFYHQDASGASLQQTNSSGNPIEPGSISEFDARGNNVGRVNPYIQLNTGGGGNEGGSSSDFGSSPYGEIDSQGNPHLKQKKERDGIPVSDSYFQNILSSGMVGGKFGLLEYNARMSNQIVGYKTRAQYLVRAKSTTAPTLKSGKSTPSGMPVMADGETEIFGMLITRSPIYNTGWGVDLAIISGERQSNDYPEFKKDDKKVITEGLDLAKKIAGNKKKKDCDEALKDYGIASISKLLEGVTLDGADANTFDGRSSSLIIEDEGVKKSVSTYFKEKKKQVGAIVLWGRSPTNQNVMFVGDYYFNPSDMNNISVQRAFIIMHEAVHLIGKKSDADFGGSKKLSQLLVEKCFPVLKGKLGGVA